MIKRILSFLIILSIAASIIVFPSFAASLTTEEKALNLKKSLSLVKMILSFHLVKNSHAMKQPYMQHV